MRRHAGAIWVCIGLAWGAVFTASQPGMAAGKDIGLACIEASGADAIAACTRAIATGRYDAEALAVLHWSRAEAFRDTGADDKALADFDQAIRIDPKLSGAYNGRGAIRAAKGERERALADFSEAIRHDPKNVQAFFNRASTWLWALPDENERAMADFAEVIHLKPDFAAAWNNRGVA